MKDQPKTALTLPHAAEKFLEVLDARTSVSMELDVEIDQVRFHVCADGDSAVISFDSMSDAMVVFKRYKAITSKSSIILIRRMLSKIGMTVCYQNRHLGFIGPKANLILSRVFNAATSFRKKGKTAL